MSETQSADFVLADAPITEWISYSEQRPSSEGPFAWRVPSVAVHGLIVTCVAHMRERGAGYTRVISPVFDYWDGYRVLVPDGLQWKSAPEGANADWHKITDLNVEGVTNAPCPYCGKEPKWDAHIASPHGGYIIGGDPHRLNEWKLNCCSWASTPRMRDPRQIAEKRNAVLNAIAKAQGHAHD